MWIRTLAIASASSAVAAIVSSRLWTAGTPIAAATTPVVVALVSEMLRRPTEKIAQRRTVETDALPEAAAAGAPPPPDAIDAPAGPAPEQPLAEPPRPGMPGASPAGVQVYRAGAGRRRVPWRLVAATAALAFVIGVVVLSIPQVIAGRSLLEGSPPGYGSASKKESKDAGADEDGGGRSPSEVDPAGEPPDARNPAERPAPEPEPQATTPAPEEEPPASAPEAPPQAPAPTPAPTPTPP